MSAVLAIECATDICSVALSNQSSVSQVHADEKHANARNLLPMVQQLLNQAELQVQDLNALHLSVGPGSFTGIRIGVSVAQGLAFGGQLKVITWNTLEIIAAAAFKQTKFIDKKLVIALDARMQEVFWAVYRWNDKNHCMQELHAPYLSGIEEFMEVLKRDWNEESCYGLGAGFAILPHRVIEFDAGVLPQARTMLEQSDVYGMVKQPLSSLAELSPLYLRNEVAWKKRERIRTER